MIRFVTRASLVLVHTKMLNLLAAVLDLAQTERSRGPFEEMSEGGELIKVLLLSANRRK
jgi:hypothetical protein